MFNFKNSYRRCSVKKVAFKNFAKLTRKHLCWSLFLIKLQVDLQLYDEETPTQLFSCEICKNFKNIFFEEYQQATASVVSFSWHLCWSLFFNNLQVFRSATLLKRDFSTGFFL